jgi:hypothetical protein
VIACAPGTNKLVDNFSLAPLEGNGVDLKGEPWPVEVLQIKRAYDRAHLVDGENGKKAMALRRWENLNPDRLRYQVIFTATDTVTADQMREARKFAEEADA